MERVSTQIYDAVRDNNQKMIDKLKDKRDVSGLMTKTYSCMLKVADGVADGVRREVYQPIYMNVTNRK